MKRGKNRLFAVTTMFGALVAAACSSPAGDGGPNPGTPPATPAITSIDSSTPGSLTVHWDAVSGATGYRLFSDWAAGGSFATQVSSTTGTSYADGSLLPKTQYYYKVQAYDGAAFSEKSASASGTTAAPALYAAPPIGFNATLGTNSSAVQMSWTGYGVTPLPGFQGYDICRSSSRYAPYAKLNAATITKTAYSDSTATPGQTYYYAVTGVFLVSGVPTEGGLTAFVPGYR
jgi:fibronectin type 3 domain-containing protein